ncbi:hypothetical protein EXVG_00447 [Emiliania huxleyi virus 202]|nr:hypothetical protein EXVG_00447 [Emiliania huxleyi virus 202]
MHPPTHPPMHPPFSPPSPEVGLNKTQITFISIGSVIAVIVITAMIAACKMAYVSFAKATHPPVPAVHPTVTPQPEPDNNAPIVSVEHLNV